VQNSLKETMLYTDHQLNVVILSILEQNYDNKGFIENIVVFQ